MKNLLKQSLLNIIGSSEFGITIRKAGKYRFPSNYMFGMHNHKEFEMNYIDSGNCVMEIGGVLTVLKRDDLILVSPGVAHYFMVGTQKGCGITQLEYEMTLPDHLEDAFQFMYGKQESIQINSCSSIGFVMEGISRYHREDKPEEYKEAQIQLSFAQLYLELAYSLMRESQKENNKILNVQGQLIKYINRNYDSKINIEQLAVKFGISSRSIRKYFEDSLEMSSTEYITMLRMEKAKEMLWNTKRSITDIAVTVGYSSSQYFSNVFNTYTGMSPGKFRNSWRGIIAEEKLNDQKREYAQGIAKGSSGKCTI